MALLDIPATGGFITKTSAREVGQKRLKRVSHWFPKPASPQALRRDSLVLQLTSAMESFMSTNPKEGDVPIVVAIQQGKAHDLLNNRLQHLLEVVHYDPDLNLAAATGALLATATNVIARLNEYKKYPYKFVTMSSKWFPVTYGHAITKFLAAPADDLDVGFSLQLQGLALAESGELEQRAFIMSDVVQQLLEGAADAFFLHSLAAERAAAEVKRRETSNITLLANVSMDLLCRRFTAQRSPAAQRIDAASEVLWKLKRSSLQAIAWEKCDVSPQGVRCTADAPLRSRTSLPATGGSASSARGNLRRRRLLSTAAAPASSIARSRSPPGFSAESGSLKEECKAESCR